MNERIIFGYCRNYTGSISIYKEQAAVVRFIYSQYHKGKTLSEIAENLKTFHIPSPTNKPVWGRQAINNILSNEKYLGNEIYPRIINKEDFDEIKEVKSQNAYSLRYHNK